MSRLLGVQPSFRLLSPCTFRTVLIATWCEPLFHGNKEPIILESVVLVPGEKQVRHSPGMRSYDYLLGQRPQKTLPFASWGSVTMIGMVSVSVNGPT